MHQLRTCDFCGGEAAGVFEVIPPELDPEPAEQRRTVLCPDCSARLETLVEPLLARAGADDFPSADAGDTTVDATGEPSAPDDASPRSNESAVEPSVAAPRSAENEADRTDATTGDGTTADDGTMEDDATTTGDATTAGDDDSSPSDATDGTRMAASRPPAYGKAMRLLSNRELPMDRDAVEGLIAGAYDLEGPEVAAVVDHGIERGRLREEGGQLHRA